MSEAKLTLTQEYLDSYEEDARRANLVEVPSLVLLSLIAAARELEARWIPVTERLPEPDTEVLVYYRLGLGEGRVVGRRVSPSGHWYSAGFPLHDSDVVAWMPLPKGPTK